MIVCGNCQAEVFWGLPRPEDLCLSCGEAIGGSVSDKNEVLENQIEDTHVDDLAAQLDPYAEWFMPGYATEMDYMNAMEADDYRDEFGDDDIEF